MIYKRTIPDILKAYKAAEQFETDDAMAEALGVSRQVFSHWMNERHQPDPENLRDMTIRFAGKWQGDMAVDILKNMESDIPCICLEQIGDNGPCPKHGQAHWVAA